MKVTSTIIEHEGPLFEDIAGLVSYVKTVDDRVFTIGTPVRKRNGYGFPGMVNAMFVTPEDKLRAVVWCCVEECKGMLHIFDFEQLEPV